MANRWLSVRLEIIGSLIILSAASVAVLSQSDWLASIGFGAGSVTAGLVGLSVSKSLDITYMLSFLIRQISEVRTGLDTAPLGHGLAFVTALSLPYQDTNTLGHGSHHSPGLPASML